MVKEKRSSWWKENSTFAIPGLILILLLFYAISYSRGGELVLSTPSAAECAKALINQAEMASGKKFRLEIVDEGTLEVINKKKAVALIAPFSLELFSAGAMPIAVDALVAVSYEGRSLNQDEISSLEKAGKFFYPPKDLWPFFNYRVAPVSKNPCIFNSGVSMGKDAVALIPWSQAQKKGLKVGAYNGMIPSENSISVLQYPLWYQIFLFTSGKEETEKAGVGLLLKAARQKGFKKYLRELGFYPWPVE